MTSKNIQGFVIAAAVLALSLFFVFNVQSENEALEADQNVGKQYAEAIFAGGCFWCMEPPFDKVAGVISTISGYTDGHKENPTYKEVSSGTTGHTEAIKITYDASKVSYKQLLDIFWRNIDPITPNRQFCDGGTQYRSGIYYSNDQQRDQAQASKTEIEASGMLKKPIVTEIKPASQFYPAEDYHQDYYLKNPIRYKFYRYNCGRDQRLEEIWG